MCHNNGKEIEVKTRIGFVILAFLMFLTGGISKVEAAEIVLRLSHMVNTQHNWHLSAVKFSELVAQRTNNKVEIKIFDSSQLGNDRDNIEGLQLGTLDMALNSTFLLGNFEPKSMIFDFPYLFRDEDHAFRVFSGPVGQYFSKLYEAKGFKALGFINVGLRHMINNKRPLYLPKDMKGLKVRSMEGPIFLATFRALGASPVPMPWGETYMALKQGVIDGTDLQFSTAVASKFWEATKYYSLTGHSLNSVVFNISLKRWNTLPPDVQKVMEDSGKEAMAYSLELNKKEAPDLIPILKKGGLKFNDVDRKPWAEAVAPVYKEFGKNVGNDLIEQIRNTK